MSDRESVVPEASQERTSIPPIAEDGEHTQRIKTLSRSQAEEVVKSHLPRPRTTAETVAAVISEAIVIALVAAIALTTRDNTLRWAAIVIAGTRLGVSAKSLKNGGMPPAGPIGMVVASMVAPIVHRAGHLALLLGLSIVPVVATSASCSASAVRRQAVASNALVVISDTALTAVGQLYEDQQKTALEAACGHTTPCADPPAAREAVAVVRRQWDPVWASWHLLEVAHASWVVQLERCQGLADAGDCGPQLSEQLVAVTQHLTELRCGLRGLHVPDPFSGPVECGGASGKDAGE